MKNEDFGFLPTIRVITAMAASAMLLACSTPATMPQDASFERDRAAILAMAGEYAVTFAFEETVALKPGYALKPPDRQDGHELVTVIENEGPRISLQHVLVEPNGLVIKHWRQDWQYQQTLSWSYIGDLTWQRRKLDADAVRGSWTQTVWQVDDSPRYAGVGRWQHQDGVSSWTSEQVWRPLPRREYTTRSDYDVLIAVNRHTITPTGWVQEEHNDKLDRKSPGGPQLLARENGINVYTRVEGYNFQPARDYLVRTNDYWREVRNQWSALLSRESTVALKDKVDGKPLFETMLAQANTLSDAAHTPAQRQAAVTQTLASYRIENTQVGESWINPATDALKSLAESQAQNTLAQSQAETAMAQFQTLTNPAGASH
jgi:hypothetical protein